MKNRASAQATPAEVRGNVERLAAGEYDGRMTALEIAGRQRERSKWGALQTSSFARKVDRPFLGRFRHDGFGPDSAVIDRSDRNWGAS